MPTQAIPKELGSQRCVRGSDEEGCAVSWQDLERKAAVKVLGYICDPDACLEMVKENIEDVTKFIVLRL
jgi:hypothetical protein